MDRPNLTDYQLDFLYNQKRYSVVQASTKSGKTFPHLWWIYEIAHGYNPNWYYRSVKPGMTFWWVAPVYSQAEIAFNRLKRKIAHTGLYRFNQKPMRIHCYNGAVIEFKKCGKAR